MVEWALKSDKGTDRIAEAEASSGRHRIGNGGKQPRASYLLVVTSQINKYRVREAHILYRDPSSSNSIVHVNEIFQV